jgi:hypothetical protein
MMCNHRGRQMIAGLWWMLLPLCLWLGAASAHQDRCPNLVNTDSVG